MSHCPLCVCITIHVYSDSAPRVQCSINLSRWCCMEQNGTGLRWQCCGVWHTLIVLRDCSTVKITEIREMAGIFHLYIMVHHYPLTNSYNRPISWFWWCPYIYFHVVHNWHKGSTGVLFSHSATTYLLCVSLGQWTSLIQSQHHQGACRRWRPRPSRPSACVSRRLNETK